MATCKDCLHYEVCELLRDEPLDVASDNVERCCKSFRSHSRYIELPCKIGSTVYRISRQHGEWKILPRKVLCITYHGGTRWALYTTKADILGDNVFLTKDEAEAEVARRETENERS